MNRRIFWPLLLACLAAACAAPPSSVAPGPSAGAGPAQPDRALIAAILVEPKTLAARIIGQSGASLSLSRRLFNADLALLDDQSNPYPYLAEALPQLYTDDWKVFPE